MRAEDAAVSHLFLCDNFGLKNNANGCIHLNCNKSNKKLKRTRFLGGRWRDLRGEERNKARKAVRSNTNLGKRI